MAALLARLQGHAQVFPVDDAVFQEMAARSQTEYVQPSVLAVAAEHARRHVEALAFLRRAVEIRDPVLGSFSLHSPGMQKLRRSPEFAEIVADLGWNVQALGV